MSRTFRFLIVLGLFVPFVVIAHASAQKNSELVVNIPFNFTACKEQMPAGKYKVLPITSANPRLLLVHGEDNRSAEIICAQDVQSSKPASGGKLIFNRYGGQYFLSQLWFAGDLTGLQVTKGDREEALLRELAPGKKSEKVTVKVTESKPN